jgi:hypothetical protein
MDAINQLVVRQRWQLPVHTIQSKGSKDKSRQSWPGAHKKIIDILFVTEVL